MARRVIAWIMAVVVSIAAFAVPALAEEGGGVTLYLSLIHIFLTSHYTPEDLKDAETKIAYLENLKKIALDCADVAAFKAEVGRQYPQYSGQNYLDMTAGFFFA